MREHLATVDAARSHAGHDQRPLARRRRGTGATPIRFPRQAAASRLSGRQTHGQGWRLVGHTITVTAALRGDLRRVDGRRGRTVHQRVGVVVFGRRGGGTRLGKLDVRIVDHLDVHYVAADLDRCGRHLERVVAQPDFPGAVSLEFCVVVVGRGA